jgi:hypothetical protein
MAKQAHDYRRGSNRRIIAECAERGLSKGQTYAELKPRVTDQTLVFKSNPPKGSGIGRQPKSISEQYVELANEIGRVWKALGLAKGAKFEDRETRDEEQHEDEDFDTDDSEDSEEEESEEDSEEESEDSIPRAKGKDSLREELNYFLRRVKEIRRFCWERARQSAPVDNISIRPAQAASRLIPAGVPADVLLLTMTMHWSPETRSDAGIDSWDFNGEGLTTPHPGMLAVSKSTMKSRGIDSHGLHPLFGYALLVAESRIPMMLIGPAGTGKSHLTEQVSTYLSSEAYPDGFPYGEAPMSAGASRSDLLGRHTINAEKPFVTAEAIERYSKGGVFSFEEIDRGDPSVLIVLNNALARGILFNPVNGENYSQHPDFVPVATANTMGLGANREYGTAERLDGATLDRFRMGRIFLPLDEGLEEEILFGRI